MQSINSRTKLTWSLDAGTNESRVAECGGHDRRARACIRVMATGTAGAAQKGHSRNRHFAGHSCNFTRLSPDLVLRVRPFVASQFSAYFNEIGIYEPQNPEFFLASQGRTVTGAEA